MRQDSTLAAVLVTVLVFCVFVGLVSVAWGSIAKACREASDDESKLTQ